MDTSQILEIAAIVFAFTSSKVSLSHTKPLFVLCDVADKKKDGDGESSFLAALGHERLCVHIIVLL